jgi:hypothetical protein
MKIVDENRAKITEEDMKSGKVKVYWKEKEIKYDKIISKLCYKRLETAKYTEIIFNTKYTYAMYLFILSMMAGYMKDNSLIGFIGFGMLMIQWVYTIKVWLPVQKQIKEAAQTGNISYYGSKNSLQNPLKYTIYKQGGIDEIHNS